MPENHHAKLERLPAGFASYLRSLAAMAAFVRHAATDYGLKLFANRLFHRAGIAGHDFQNEISTLFFSLVIGSVIRVIRLTLNWCRTRGGRLKRLRATVTIRSRCLRRFWRSRALVLGLWLAVIRRMNRRMFGSKSILIGRANGWHWIRRTNKRCRVGFKNSLINTPTTFGRMTPARSLYAYC